MRNWKHRRGGDVPPFVDSAFAEALGGKSGRRPKPKVDYKSLQLCRQVQRILTLELAGEDELLAWLYVARVEPAAGSSQLLVHVVVPSGVSVMEVLGRLGRAAPRLRAAVAAGITRKRAPDLAFVPSAGWEVGHE